MSKTTQFVDEDQLPIQGLVKQEFITYHIVRDKMHKTTVTRTYQKGADYIDHTVTEVLYAAN